jgi:hypothetical protein
VAFTEPSAVTTVEKAPAPIRSTSTLGSLLAPLRTALQ